MKNSIIKLEDVWKVYPMGEGIEVTALRGISLEVKKEEFIVILGPSGSGKSTLLHMVGLLDAPTKGRVYFSAGNGVGGEGELKEISGFSEDELAEIRNKKIGFVFQSFNLLTQITALLNVELPLVFQGLSKSERRERALFALKSVGLEKRVLHKPTQLSGGEKQRVSIARAIAENPDLIVADEPTGNIDSKTGKQILEILSDLNKKDKKTLIVVTHDETIAEFADRVIRIKDGQIDGSD